MQRMLFARHVRSGVLTAPSSQGGVHGAPPALIGGYL